MYLVGLTGGIASGKSFVASLLAEHGASTIDADEVAREVVSLGSPGLAAVASAFGPDVILPSGELDRKRLGDVIFSDPESRLRLEAILHPLIKIRTTELINSQSSEIVVYSVPLLVEAKVDYPFDSVITVEAGQENQIERLVTAGRGELGCHAHALLESIRGECRISGLLASGCASNVYSTCTPYCAWDFSVSSGRTIVR